MRPSSHPHAPRPSRSWSSPPEPGITSSSTLADAAARRRVGGLCPRPDETGLKAPPHAQRLPSAGASSAPDPLLPAEITPTVFAKHRNAAVRGRSTPAWCCPGGFEIPILFIATCGLFRARYTMRSRPTRRSRNNWLGGHIQVDVVALGHSIGRLVFGAWQVDGCDLVERIEPGYIGAQPTADSASSS